jgi:hypothetical protein
MPSDSVEVGAADWTMGIEIIEYPHLRAVGKRQAIDSLTDARNLRPYAYSSDRQHEQPR